MISKAHPAWSAEMRCTDSLHSMARPWRILGLDQCMFNNNGLPVSNTQRNETDKKLEHVGWKHSWISHFDGVRDQTRKFDITSPLLPICPAQGYQIVGSLLSFAMKHFGNSCLLFFRSAYHLHHRCADEGARGTMADKLKLKASAMAKVMKRATY